MAVMIFFTKSSSLYTNAFILLVISPSNLWTFYLYGYLGLGSIYDFSKVFFLISIFNITSPNLYWYIGRFILFQNLSTWHLLVLYSIFQVQLHVSRFSMSLWRRWQETSLSVFVSSRRLNIKFSCVFWFLNCIVYHVSFLFDT